MEYKMYDYENDVDPESYVFNQPDTCRYFTDNEFNDNVKLNDTFSLIHFNCRSLYANFEKINEYLSSIKGKFKLIALSETWLSKDKGADMYIEGYELHHVNRGNKKGGGVALYVDSDLKCKPVKLMTSAIDDLMECLTVEIEMENGKNIVVTCVYRTPSSNIEIFKDKLEELMDRLNEKKIFIMCGDFNIDLLNISKHKATSDFLDGLYSRGLYPLITRPSRITSTGATLIDNIFVNVMQNTIRGGLLINDISDHLPVFSIYNCQMKEKVKKVAYRSARVRTTEAIDKFRTDLLKEQWNDVYVGDVNVAYDSFLNSYLSLYNKHCPLRQFKQNSRYNNKPWITKGLQNACKKKNKLYRDFIKFRTKTAEKQYKVYKNKLTVIMRQAKKDYYNKRLQENKGDIKGSWKILNDILRNKPVFTNTSGYFTNDKNRILENMQDVVNEFNFFFVNVGPNLAKSIKKRDESQTKDGRIEGGKMLQSMFVGEVNNDEIVSIVGKFKNKTSIDSDGIDMIIVKKTIDCIIKPLCYIFNLSFRAGVFPDRMKTAKVIPLFKTGDKYSFTNYRPVSLLSQFSKVFEKVFANKLDNFIEKNKLISESQFGFRSNRSTSLALMKITEEITTAIEKNKYTIGVFIDLKKAFDTIDHKILISKLQTYGLRGVVLSWLSSYLDKRQQFVQFSGYKSECLNLECGVPQGSVLGPKLFNLYINDLCEVSKSLQSVLFADDTNFFCSGEDLKTLAVCVETEMVNLKKWFDENKLSLNLNKTKFMVFTNKRKDENILLNIDGVSIERVSEFRFLGVIIDDKLTWKAHIAHVKSKVSKNIFILNKVKFLLNCKVLRILYCSLILPYFSYCVEIWGNTYISNIKPLFLLQKRAVRIIHKAGYREHTSSLFIKSGLLKLKDLIELQTLTVMFRAKSKALPENLQKLFVFSSEDEIHRRKFNFKHQFARTTLKQMCISVVGVKMWNSLHSDIKSCLNICQFKRMYKERLIRHYEHDD